MRTARQGQSGLGLEAQQQIVMDLPQRRQMDPGRRLHRVKSGKATPTGRAREGVAHVPCPSCDAGHQQTGRPCRDAAWLLGLEKQGDDFVIASAPNVNRLTIGVLALVAEQERRDISIRTKAALAMAKARGVKLGRPENLSRQDVGSVPGNEAKARRRTHVLPICCR